MTAADHARLTYVEDDNCDEIGLHCQDCTHWPPNHEGSPLAWCELAGQQVSDCGKCDEIQARE